MNSYIFLITVLVVLAAAIFIALKTTIVLTDIQYDRLKFVTENFCPALVIFITALTKLWNIPMGIESAGLISAVAILIRSLVNCADETWRLTSDKDLRIAREQSKGYMGERFYTDENGCLIEEDEDE